jgi:hypothetical protein
MLAAFRYQLPPGALAYRAAAGHLPRLIQKAPAFLKPFCLPPHFVAPPNNGF